MVVNGRVNMLLLQMSSIRIGRWQVTENAVMLEIEAETRRVCRYNEYLCDH